jgi:hypothetical protein
MMMVWIDLVNFNAMQVREREEYLEEKRLKEEEAMMEEERSREQALQLKQQRDSSSNSEGVGEETKVEVATDEDNDMMEHHAEL